MKEFKNLSEFERFLTNVISREKVHNEATLSVAATYIEEEAKRKFGIKQDPVGPFNGWKDLAEATQEDRIQKGYEPNNPLYRTGDLMNSIHHKVEGNEAVVGSDDERMVWQELGTPDAKHPIPPRPVLGPAAFQSKAKVQKLIAKGVFAWLSGSGAINKKSLY